ncbi:N-acetyltransferase ESCO2 [Anoplophora glabripennis]|uniref:N-acetyltransferase ESCO2 n=1 Tax=Anoplophora glabripennis TaxID=217634 RepID=UPI000874CB9D|nr:N-acetyltransferase ESCO2 [Anoplophora glabripennis]
MMDSRKGQISTHYEHTSHVLERRRSLFPSDIDSEEDSDLGHISPLHFDSDLEDINYLQQEDNGLLLSRTDTIEDYDILGVVEHIQGSICTPINAKYACSETMSPLYISPCMKFSENTVVNETPSKISPIYKLKTPHDTCNTNSKLPKLVRKSLLDSSENSLSKRQLSPLNYPEEIKNKTKHLKVDPKNSKVRTTLFPEVDISLPTKSFYPKTESIMDKVQSKNNIFNKSPVLNNSTRKIRTRKRIGQINAGVHHKIRKPKQKSLNRVSLVKAAINAVNNSAINEYIKDLKQLNMPQNEHIPLIENKENKDPSPASKVVDQKFSAPKLIETKTFADASKLETCNTKKRPLSPISEPDPKKKFFKLSRAKGVVTVNKNIKVQVDHGKMTLIEKGKKKKSQKIDYDSSDLTVDEPLLPNIDSILSSLENDSCDMKENSSKLILQAHCSVSASENSILLHPQPAQCTANLILSPISQMCDVTSGLALNSPKKVKNLTSILNEMPSGTPGNVDDANIFDKQNSSNVVKQKLFPIFCSRNIAIPEKKESKTFTRTAKRFKNLEESQMLIDAGQKKFGVTQCLECNIVYHIGDPSDENMHLNYHNAGHVLKFSGWKNEKVVADFHNNGRIIQIVPGDSKIWWKKVKDLMDVINRELGCFELEFSLDHCQIFLYIKSRSIIGCVVTVPKTEGHRMLTSKQNEADMCSEENYPIKCGISRIWVSHNYRKQGIGSALMNCVKKNFMFGYILDNNDIAFSPPTEQGKNFAKSYFKTPNYLIYYV